VGSTVSFAILAADAQEIVVGDAVRLVDDALVALFLERFLRQGGRRAGAADQDGIRLGGQDLENLPGHRGVDPVESARCRPP
jgi:hypothetical protein